MATQVETGNFVANTGGTTTTVTTGFQGKGLILFTHTKTTEGESAGALFSMGFADNGARVGVMAWSGDDAVATSNTGRSKYSNRALQINSDGTPTQVCRVASVAFNAAPNFVLTFNITPASAWEISYILIGGTDITNTFVGSTTVATSISTQNIIGVGFQPDAVFVIHALGVDATNTVARAGIGMAVSAAKQWSWFGSVADGATTSAAVDGLSLLRNDVLISGEASGVNALLADFTQFTGDGFDINVSDAAPASWQMSYLCIKGGQWDAGVQAKPATATTQTFNVAFTPKGIGFLMSSATALNTYTSECISTWGAWDGTTEVYSGAYHNDAINIVAKSAGASTKVLREIGYTAEADGTTLAANTVITWDAAGTAYLVAWWAAGDNAGGGSPPAAAFGDYAGQFRIIRPTSW